MHTNIGRSLRIALFMVATACGMMPADLAALTTAPSWPIQVQSTAAGDYGAVSLLGEVGYRNYRGSGTYGVYFTPCQRFKITGEYLVQKLNYRFDDEHSRKWVSQYAIGAEYQFLLSHSTLQSIDIGTAYVHAFSHRLSDIDSATLLPIERRIAGSDGALSFLGTISPMEKEEWPT